MIDAVPPPELVIPRPAIIRPAPADILRYARDPVLAALGVTQLSGFGAGAAEADVTPLSASYLTWGSQGSGSTTYTFSGVTLGAAPSAGEKRWIVVAWFGMAPDSLSSCSVAGQTGTILVQEVWTTSYATVAAITVAEVPSGTTGDYVATWNTSLNHYCGFMSYRVISGSGADLTSTYDTGQAFDNSGGNLALNLNAKTDGLIIGAVQQRNGTGWGWTGLTEDDDQDMSSGEYGSVAMLAPSSDETPRTVTATPAGGPAATVGLSASWGPNGAT